MEEMITVMNPMNQILTLTDRARQHLINVAKSQDKNYVLFGVDGGGGAGYSYYWEVADELKDDTGEVIELGDGKSLAVDPASIMYITGSNIDYVNEIMGSMIKVENPLAQSSCGCGESISFNF